MIEDGKPLVGVSEDVWRVWREYEGRAEQEEKENDEVGEKEES